MTEENPLVVDAALKYLYHSDYNDGSERTHAYTNMTAYTPPFAQRPPPTLYSTRPENTGDPRLLFNTRVYIFAHKYKIETPRNLAASKFRAIAHAPLPTLLVPRTDMLENTPALIQAGQLLCEVLNDPVERRGDLPW